MMHNSQNSRLITGDMWRIISEVFPEAVAHRYEHPRDDALGSCQKCLLENEEDGQDKSRAKRILQKVLCVKYTFMRSTMALIL